MRSGIAEAERFPELTRGINEMARKRAATNLAKLLGELAREEGIAGRGAFAPDKITDTARIFLDLVLFAMLIRRLLGEDIKSLKKDLPAYVRQRVDFFLAACGRG
jgi:AefR-like transcriptional repressor, C-terminal domain